MTAAVMAANPHENTETIRPPWMDVGISRNTLTPKKWGPRSFDVLDDTVLF